MRIPGHEEYDVAVDGTVTSHVHPKPKVLKQKVGDDGYPRVAIRGRWMLTHRLVLMTFVGPCPDGMEGRHLDGDPLNSHVGNLRWSTHRENLLDKRIHGTDHNATKTHCLNGHPYDKENTYMRPDRPGQRTCRACNREIARSIRRKVVAP